MIQEERSMEELTHRSFINLPSFLFFVQHLFLVAAVEGLLAVVSLPAEGGLCQHKA